MQSKQECVLVCHMSLPMFWEAELSLQIFERTYLVTHITHSALFFQRKTKQYIGHLCNNKHNSNNNNNDHLFNVYSTFKKNSHKVLSNYNRAYLKHK